MGSSQTPAAHALVALGDTFNWLGVFGLEIVREVFFPQYRLYGKFWAGTTAEFNFSA